MSCLGSMSRPVPHALGAKPFYSVGEGVRGVTGKVTSPSRAVITSRTSGRSLLIQLHAGATFTRARRTQPRIADQVMREKR